MMPEEKAAMLGRLVAANVVFRDLRESLGDAAELAKQNGAQGLAFAAYHLAESLRVYAAELSKFICARAEAEDD